MNEALHQSWLLHIQSAMDEETVVRQELKRHNIVSTEVIWVNQPGEHLSIDNVRSMVGQLAYNTDSNKIRCFIISQIEQGSLPAQHAVLKSLEEPPAHTLILATTSRISDVLPTIRSRCKEIVVNSTPSSDHHEKLVQDTEAMYQKIMKSEYFELIQLAGTYKDRDQAQRIVTQMIYFLSQQQLLTSAKSASTMSVVHQLRLLLETGDQLQHNTNVRLTLENCFMALSDSNY